jgi:c-di-GMP-binding flagellar brake protein YcgR
MKLNEIPISTKLEIEAYNNLGEKYDFILISQLESVDSDVKAVIYAPIREGVIFPLRIGSFINIYFSVKVAENDYHLYKFKAQVIARKIRDGIAMLLIEIESDIIRVQRRQFFRFVHMMPVKYRWLQDEKKENDETEAEKVYKDTFTIDISGEGICIYTEEKPVNGSKVECILPLDSDGKMIFRGKIVRVSRCNNEGKFNYENGVSFIDISEREREKLIKFIFDIQRKLRKKGLI